MPKSRDESKTLEDLSPVEMYPFAVYFPIYEDPKHYKVPYRRYRTKAHAKTAARAGGNRYISEGTKVYEFNFNSEIWEEVND